MAKNNNGAIWKSLKYVFGKTVLNDIAKLPVQILEAGLKALKDQASNSNPEA